MARTDVGGNEGGGAKATPSLPQSLLPLIALGVFLGAGYGIFRLPIEILLLAAAAVAGAVGIYLGYSYKELESGILDSLLKGMPAILIIIVVGALIGSWIAAGSIPFLIFLGLKVISPTYFLITACLVCSIVSVVTGTSYGTAGTIGVAFMGIAEGLGIPAGQAAGAIVAGAYFGDKISPFSDTTNLAPIAAQSNLFDHIRHMLWTTTPAWLLGLLVYFIVGLAGGTESDASLTRMQAISNTLEQHFRFHWLLLLPPAITLYAAIRQKPIIPSMLLSAGVAVVLALVLQRASLLAAATSMVQGYIASTGEATVDTLLTRGGMISMMRVTLITFCAFAFGGIVQKTGMLDVLLTALLRWTRSTGALIASTSLSCVTVALMTGSSYLSILIPGELFAPAYRQRGLAAKNLSRTTEDSGTVVMPLIPWSIASVFMAGTLGVPTLVYAPWAIFCYTGIVFALLYGLTGFAIAPKIRDDETAPGS